MGKVVSFQPRRGGSFRDQDGRRSSGLYPRSGVLRGYNESCVSTQVRPLPQHGEPFLVGDWLVEPSVNRLTRGDQTVQLELKAMEVLLCLVESAGEVVTKRQILDMVWQTEFVSDNTLQRRVAELRGAFGDDRKAPSYIETIHKLGYRLIAPVEGVALPVSGGEGATCWLICESSSIPLQPGETVIGRGTEADIVIRSPKVSRRHARIAVDANQAVIEDLGSTNGTSVNGSRLDAPRALLHGDEIQIGRGARVYQFARSDTDAETVPSVAAPSSPDPE